MEVLSAKFAPDLHAEIGSITITSTLFRTSSAARSVRTGRQAITNVLYSNDTVR